MFKKTKEIVEKDYVFCEECGLAVRKSRSQKIMINDYFKEYYCEKHKKPYDYMYVNMCDISGKKYYKTKVEVDEKGKVIK